MRTTGFSFAILCLILARISLAQVNTEAMRKSDLKPGLTSTNTFNIQMAKGNSDYFIYYGQFRLDYLKGTHHVFSIVNLKRGEQKKHKFINKGFIHLRFVRSFNSVFYGEIFGQLEYNDFIKLRKRQLLGSGIRIRALNNPKIGDFFIGIGMMREIEEYTIASEGTKSLWRSTNYLAGNVKLNQSVNFFAMGYYQVAVSSIDDFRILADSGFSFKISKYLIFSTKIHYRFDNEPLPNIKKGDLNILNSISVRL